MVGRMTSQDYDAFVSQKLTRQPPTGLSTVPALHDGLFTFQRDLVAWALRRGRAELKESYFKQACSNLKTAETMQQGSLFASVHA